MADGSSPVTVLDLPGVPDAVALGGRDAAGSTCAWAAAFDVFCWGYAGEGQLADGGILIPFRSVAMPTPAMGLPSRPSDLSMGRAHACAISGERVYCTGQNDRGQVGDNTTDARNVYVPVEPWP